jgi:phage terminase small subunit
MSKEKETECSTKLIVVAAKSHKLADEASETDRDELSDQEREFVERYTSDPKAAGNATKSALAAGYAEGSAYNSGCRLMKRPRVRDAIDAALRSSLNGKLAVKAVSVLAAVLEDESANQKLRAEVAMKVVEYSGVIQRAQLEKAKETGLSSGKRLGEMSRDELAAIVAAGAALVAGRAQDSAQTIDVTPR